MEVLKFRIVFEKKTTRIKSDKLKDFVSDLLRDFGGDALLSSTQVSVDQDSLVSIATDNTKLVNGAMALCGSYKNVPCRFVGTACENLPLG